MLKKAMILTWDGFQDQEVIYPYHRLKEDYFDVDIFAWNNQVTGLYGTKFDSIPLNNIDNKFEKLYDFMVLPGGVKALEKIRQEKKILSFIHFWNENNKIIASICHGSQLLISSKVVKGRKISGYYSIEDDINNAGAEYSKEPVVTDKNIISCPHYKYMGNWMKIALERYYEKYDR